MPFFCAGAPTALAWGRGDRLLACPAPPRAPVVVVVPRERTSTASAYRGVSAKLALPARPTLLRGIDGGNWKALATLQHGNDFERVTFPGAPALAELCDTLASSGALVARMTGSGSALFGVFEDRNGADAAAAKAGELDGVAAAFVVPTLTEMPTPQRIRSKM